MRRTPVHLAGAGEPTALALVIDRLERSYVDSPLSTRECGELLERVTGQHFGLDVEAWRRWWRATHGVRR